MVPKIVRKCYNVTRKLINIVNQLGWQHLAR